MPVEIPDDFYKQVAMKHEKPETEQETTKFDYQEKLPNTRPLYYEDVDILEFEG